MKGDLAWHRGVVAKYDPLFQHLCKVDDAAMTMTFEDIEALVGPLPASATTYRPWWGNQASGRHMQAHAWLNAGREVETVDLARRTVRFSGARWRRGS